MVGLRRGREGTTLVHSRLLSKTLLGAPAPVLCFSVGANSSEERESGIEGEEKTRRRREASDGSGYGPGDGGGHGPGVAMARSVKRG